VLGSLPDRVDAFQWHHYTYALPAGAEELASSPVCTQAFRLDGHAWGIQFHAEVTRSMIEAWVAEAGHDLPVPSAQLLAETASRIGTWNAHGRRLSAAFLESAARA
jgi:GMP synthase-like glutamine amidotransferase